MAWLATWVEDGDERRRWALSELLEAAGIPARPVAGPDAPRPGPLLVHGSVPADHDVLVIPIDDDAPGSWPAAVAGGADLAGDIAGSRLPLDVVRTVTRLLDDEPGAVRPDPGSVAPDTLDAHDRLRYPAARAALADIPTVDHVADAVGQWIAARAGIGRVARWPNGARAAVGLSHDVDHPDRDGILRAVLARPTRLRRAPRTLLGKAADQARRRLRDPDPAAFWAFDALVEAEGRRGFRSTYHFASTPFWGPWGTDMDVAYDVTEARFKPVFARLRETGNEIALHAGYAAWAAAGRIEAERRRLEDAAGVAIRGNRHHYWHLGPDPAATLRGHGAAGLAWDASIAFNDNPGFRRSVSVPFRPFDAVTGGPLGVLQLPTACMDGAIFYRNQDVDAAVRTLETLLVTVEASGGAFVLDWHLQASVETNPEYRAWATAYQALLDIVAARDGLWVTGLDELERWWTRRRGELRPGA